MTATIRPAVTGDAAAICGIYNHYIEHTVVTFEEIPLDESAMQQRIGEVTKGHPWLVLDSERGVRGYAYASPWKSRCAFRHSVESSVYLHPDARGRGLGEQLYVALLDELRRRSCHAVIAGISLPNPSSVRLHERLGFRKTGHFEQVGWKFDRWIDVGYWQLILS